MRYLFFPMVVLLKLSLWFTVWFAEAVLNGREVPPMVWSKFFLDCCVTAVGVIIFYFILFLYVLLLVKIERDIIDEIEKQSNSILPSEG